MIRYKGNSVLGFCIWRQTRVLVSKETVVLRRWGSETQNLDL